MARVKRAVHSKKRRRTVLERAQGFYGNKSRSYTRSSTRIATAGPGRAISASCGSNASMQLRGSTTRPIAASLQACIRQR
jgi:hypothetical protein